MHFYIIGGGSKFLKTNTKKLVSQNSDSQIDIGAASFDKLLDDIEFLPKSILRDRSLPETQSQVLKETENEPDDKLLKKESTEEDRKSVRFNLAATISTNPEIDFNFSDSDEKDSFEEEIEIFAETKLKARPEIPIKNSRFTVSPVIFDEYGPKKSSDSIFSKIENAEKLEENSSPRNSNLKLIRPNPTDFITPKIINKPLDVIKPISLLSDSEDECAGISKFIAKFPKEENLMTEKLSHVQDSIPEENTADRSIEISYEEKLDSEYKEKNDLKIELANDIEKYRDRLIEENKKELESLRKAMLVTKEKEVEKLRRSILESQEKEMKELLEKEKESQSEKLKDLTDKLREEMDEKYKTILEEEEKKIENIITEKRADMEKQFQKTIDKIELHFKEKEKEIESNFQISLKQNETDFLLKLEERIKEISAAHKAVIDRMKDDQELTLAELVRDFKSEVISLTTSLNTE